MTASKPKQVGWCAANGEILSLSGKKQWLRLGGSLGKTAGRFDEPLIRLTDHERLQADHEAARAADKARIEELKAERDEWHRLFDSAGQLSKNACDDLNSAKSRIAELVLSLHTVVGMLHHRATTPLERQAIRIAETALAPIPTYPAAPEGEAMPQTHYKVLGIDARNQGQSQYEFDHQAACGYVRDEVTKNGDAVTCKLCLRSEHMKQYHRINGTLTDSSGCI